MFCQVVETKEGVCDTPLQVRRQLKYGRRFGHLIVLASLALPVLAGCSPAATSASSGFSATPRPTAVRPTVAPTLTAKPSLNPVSWLRNATLLTIYGRAFGTAPILGRLGMDNSFDDVTRQARPFWQGIHANNGGKKIKIGIHLIYGLAKPCDSGDNCLIYLDDAGVDIVKTYIQPAARRGWLVILDDQLGRSDPAAEVRRMIARGYLKYDNVAVALDPEFRAAPGQLTPGIPVGSATAGEVNAAQSAINSYQRGRHPAHKTIVMVHQFQQGMIENRERIWNRFKYTDSVIVADGFGAPATKADNYTGLMGPHSSAGIKFRGLKLFYPNPYEHAGHFDNPVLTWRQVFGRAWIVENGKQFSIWPSPSVIVVA